MRRSYATSTPSATTYGRQGPAQRHARGIRTRLQQSKMDGIFQRGLHEFNQRIHH